MEYLIHLTIDEFKKIIQETVEKTINTISQEVDIDKIHRFDTDTIKAAKVAEILGVKVTTIYAKINQNYNGFNKVIIKKGKPLLFSRRALLDWIKDNNNKNI
jgi:predicted DNA-binding transcriptional regulator AlpA